MRTYRRSTRLGSQPLTSGAEAEERFGKQDFIYVPDNDTYRCPAVESLTSRFTTVERGIAYTATGIDEMRELLAEVSMHDARAARIKRWEHEAVLNAMQSGWIARPIVRNGQHSKESAIV